MSEFNAFIEIVLLFWLLILLIKKCFYIYGMLVKF